MGYRSLPIWHRLLIGLRPVLCLTLFYVLFPAYPTHAQEHDFAISAQPLDKALIEFATQAGVSVNADPALLAGRQSMGVMGHHTNETALEQLLKDSGLQANQAGPNTFTILPVPVPHSSSQPAADTFEEKQQKPVKVPEVVVKEVRQKETADLSNLPTEYAGGDVARGGRVGILGNRDMMDTPFTQMTYTSKLIQNQQTRFLGDVLRNDPSVQINQSTASAFMNYSVRGFIMSQGDTLFNGLAIAPVLQGTMMTEGIERVEVLRGPNALLHGAAPGGSIGGMVNVVPKRAGDEALTQITAQYLTDTQGGGHVDVGRRFGTNKQFGVRINGVYRNGNLSIDHVSRESAMATVGLDYRGDLVRVSADFGYQEQEVLGGRRQFNVAGSVIALPGPPNTSINANQPWEPNRNRAFYGTLRGEVDVTKQITAFADFGIIKDRRQSILTNRVITDSQGSLAPETDFSFAFDFQVLTFNTGLRGVFDTGPIHHRAVAAYTQNSTDALRSLNATASLPASNIYNPVFASAPPSSVFPSHGDMRPSSEINLHSAMLGDTLSILDERVQLTTGFRFQQIKVTEFNLTTGAVSDSYDKSAVTPMVGLVVRPWQKVSLYGNFVEGLQQGPMAPLGAANAGEVFAPFRSRGYEAGVKVDFGRLAATLAGFQITQPSAFINPTTNVFGVDGERRHRGVELSVFGEVTEGLRLLGGTSYIDAELTKTEGGVNEGNKAPLTPFTFTFYGEWDVPMLKGITLTSRVTHGSSQYINFANTQKIPSWTQWDLGARYRVEYMNGKPITIRAFLENLLDTNAWYGTMNAGQIYPRDPRTFLLSATFDF
ncbi:MAG: TonB-dependent receptor [Nitrospira sp.]